MLDRVGGVIKQTFIKGLSVASIWQSLGVFFGVLAVIISLIHIFRHIWFNESVIRKCTVRILLMVPIYAIDSAVCLIFENTEWKWSVPISLIREVYEAIALLSFMQFVLTVKGGALQIAEILQREHPGEVNHMPPVKWILTLPPFTRCFPASYAQGPYFIAHMLGGIAQYAVVMIIVFMLNIFVWMLTIAKIVEDKGLLHKALVGVPDQFKACSNGWALYCLVLFAHTASDVFPRARFGCKVLAIKGIVFFTFWQEKVITVLYHSGMLDKLLRLLNELAKKLQMGEITWENDNYQRGLNDFLLCIETFAFCFIHWCAYRPREWKDSSKFKIEVQLSNPSAVEDREPFIMPTEAFLGHLVEIKQIFGDIYRLRDKARDEGALSQK
mmetsp:Transcript_127353/g.224246  ORF Transcript_127353/g.224246 Transcript_127353/m.224246 type:complete len:384 (+) Transcript_127353:94-1245(+)